MKKEEAISYLQQLYPNGGHCWLDEQRIEAISMAINALQEEPVSEELEEVSTQYGAYEFSSLCNGCKHIPVDAFKDGAKWQKNHLWKPADGDDLPEIDREVIALEGIVDQTETDCFCWHKVVFAHRPASEGYDGKSIITGEVKHYTPETYDKGGWNIPNVKYWLDCQIPNMEED